MIVESERASSVFGVDSENDEDIQDINGLMVYYLRTGESIKSFDYSNGGANYGEFITSTIRLMATARRVSYELAFRDYSQVNFSSARASLIQDNKTFDYEQAHFSRYVLDNIFKTWLKLEINLGRLPISRNAYTKDAKLYHQIRWSFPKREWVDPVKDLTALSMEINLGLTTRTDACMRRGVDYEEVIETQKREMDYKKATLGEHYAEAIALENRNQDLLEIILGGTQENENQN